MPDVVVVPSKTSDSTCSAAELAAARAEASQLRAELQAAKAAAYAREVAASRIIESTNAELCRVRARGVELQRRLTLSEQLRAFQRTRQITPTERVLRRAFAAKVEELALTHARTTARMLNVQKRCFEEELESLESEAHATVTAFERHISSLRADAHMRVEQHKREKEMALTKTTTVMDAVKLRIEQIERKLVEEQSARKRAEIAAEERHRQLTAVWNRSKAVEREVTRKNGIVDTLQTQLDTAWKEVQRAREAAAVKNSMKSSTTTSDVAGCGAVARLVNSRLPTRNDPDTKRLGAVFASVMADFVNAQSDVSSGDGDDEREDSSSTAANVVHVTSSASA